MSMSMSMNTYKGVIVTAQSWQSNVLRGVMSQTITGVFSLNNEFDDTYHFQTSVDKIIKIQQKSIVAILVDKHIKLNIKYPICFCDRYPLEMTQPPLPLYSLHRITKIEMVAINAKAGIMGTEYGVLSVTRQLGFSSFEDLLKSLDLGLFSRKAWGGQLVFFK